MTTHTRISLAGSPQDGRRTNFEYRNAPHAGLNWPFAQDMILSLISWSSAAASMVFWGCLLAAAVH